MCSRTPLNAYYVPSTMPGSTDKTVNKTHIDSLCTHGPYKPSKEDRH